MQSDVLVYEGIVPRRKKELESEYGKEQGSDWCVCALLRYYVRIVGWLQRE